MACHETDRDRLNETDFGPVHLQGGRATSGNGIVMATSQDMCACMYEACKYNHVPSYRKHQYSIIEVHGNNSVNHGNFPQALLLNTRVRVFPLSSHPQWRLIGEKLPGGGGTHV